MLKNPKEFFNIPDDIGLDGFQPSFCRKIHRNFYKMKGEPRQDRIKNAGRVLRRFIGTICEPTPISKYCKYLFLWKEAVFRHSLPFAHATSFGISSAMESVIL